MVSTVSASANEFGGITMWSLPVTAVSMVMNRSFVKVFGSTMAVPPLVALVKTLNLVPTRTS